jgi:hypothetical protein
VISPMAAPDSNPALRMLESNLQSRFVACHQ